MSCVAPIVRLAARAARGHIQEARPSGSPSLTQWIPNAHYGTVEIQCLTTSVDFGAPYWAMSREDIARAHHSKLGLSDVIMLKAVVRYPFLIWVLGPWLSHQFVWGSVCPKLPSRWLRRQVKRHGVAWPLLHPSWDARDVEPLIRSFPDHLKYVAASLFKLSDRVWVELASDECPYVRAMAVRHATRLPGELWMSLATDDYQVVRKSVASAERVSQRIRMVAASTLTPEEHASLLTSKCAC